MFRSSQARQRNARRGLVRTSRNRRTAVQRLRARSGEARMLRGLSRDHLGFPATMVTKLRYSTFITLTASGGAVAGNIYCANGIFDPDITGIGHQPMYRDTYAAIYDSYTVLGSKITVRYAPGSGIPCQVGINKDDDATATNNLETLMEQAGGVFGVVGALGSEPGEFVSNFVPLRDIGVAAKDDGSSATPQAQNPTEIFVYKVWAISADAVTPTSCVVQVVIDYTVKFSQLITPVQN